MNNDSILKTFNFFSYFRTDNLKHSTALEYFFVQVFHRIHIQLTKWCEYYPKDFQFCHKQEWNTLLITSVARSDIS